MEGVGVPFPDASWTLKFILGALGGCWSTEEEAEEGEGSWADVPEELLLLPEATGSAVR